MKFQYLGGSEDKTKGIYISMITFGEFMTEIAVNPDAPEFSNSSSSPRRSSKIMPDEGKFNIIP